MKNIKILLSIAILLTIILTANCVMAAGYVTWATGASTQTGSVGEVKTSTLGFTSSSQLIGIVSGTISFNSEYITDVKVEQADWMLTYNPNNGKFNAVKSRLPELIDPMSYSTVLCIDTNNIDNKSNQANLEKIKQFIISKNI
jgi:hypothetical protein